MSIAAVTASGCLALALSVALLDDGLFLVIVFAVSTMGLVGRGIARLLAAAGPSRS